MSQILPRHTRGILVATALVSTALLVPTPAAARVFVGFGFPFFFGPPPIYYPPPAYYYPPPAYYPPPVYYSAPPAYAPQTYGYQAAPSRQSCQTSGPICPMEHAVTPGSSCYCDTGQGRVWGRAT
jgi:hypothetical protein